MENLLAGSRQKLEVFGMDNENLMVLVVGLLLIVSIFQAFQLNSMMGKFGSANAQYGASSGNAQTAGLASAPSSGAAQQAAPNLAQAAAAQAPASSVMVGGC